MLWWLELRVVVVGCAFFFFFKQKTAYDVRISDWSSDVCASDLITVWAKSFKGTVTANTRIRVFIFIPRRLKLTKIPDGADYFFLRYTLLCCERNVIADRKSVV